ncbi:MAG TPA: hypothetical protein ENG14_00215 [Thermodesulforhabdus norvegica]|uniref:Uncharacterized protein n=1 Tax=Thermodesulforhabdus norvegica TaxID=39841 RepID=A0A7C1AVJ2_9BACT|nr:hypothetical protein [Deltaproteobacteria bacterium]MBW2068305.1 hypothetical protein [Deltaproteobacteria bacterium]HDL89311.1 hypothetical protein [Thermodesulforhabdus norvegica]
MEREDLKRKLKESLGRVNVLLSELEEETRKLQVVSDMTDSEVDAAKRRCRDLRRQLETDINLIKTLVLQATGYFDRDEEIVRIYNDLHERLRQAQDITMQTIKSLQSGMTKIEEEMELLRKKEFAIKKYKLHQAWSQK